MTRIEILGPGCARCQALYQRADQAARELGIEYEITKVSDLETILSYGAMSTPGLVVNGTLKMAGRVPSAEQLKGLLE